MQNVSMLKPGGFWSPLLKKGRKYSSRNSGFKHRMLATPWRQTPQPRNRLCHPGYPLDAEVAELLYATRFEACSEAAEVIL
jgi:hypothetical protein